MAFCSMGGDVVAGVEDLAAALGGEDLQAEVAEDDLAGLL